MPPNGTTPPIAASLRTGRIKRFLGGLYLVLLAMMPNSASMGQEQVYTSPDGSLVAMVAPAGKKKGFEAVESRIAFRLRKGNLLLSKDFSSQDGEHGAGILHGQWTSDSKFFVFVTEFSGGHSPLQHPIYFYCRQKNTISMLNQFLDGVLTRDFSLQGNNTVVVEAQDMRGIRKISVKLGGAPCEPIATCYRLGSPHRTVPASEYIFREDFNSQTSERKLYVRRRGENEPRLIFTYSGGASECVGPSGRLALINSPPGTKAEEVYVADLSSGRNWRIDVHAMGLYEAHAQPNPALIIVPHGEDMSPGDSKVLLRMDLIYISVQTPEEAEKLGRTFQQWRYVVDSRDGKVLWEYRTLPPARWWAETKSRR